MGFLQKRSFSLCKHPTEFSYTELIDSNHDLRFFFKNTYFELRYNIYVVLGYFIDNKIKDGHFIENKIIDGHFIENKIIEIGHFIDIIFHREGTFFINRQFRRQRRISNFKETKVFFFRDNLRFWVC